MYPLLLKTYKVQENKKKIPWKRREGMSKNHLQDGNKNWKAMGEDVCHQAWGPEFNSLDLHTGRTFT